ncbi:STAS domain-containing protein [Streptomyces amritsarensis]|uniref:hypothetical protein n=1 Tax=Streptomyces amritsarensis TaxID=681158 RepID=UPI00369D05AF
MDPTLGVDVAVHPGHTVVRVAGELDTDTCPRLAEVTDALTLHGRLLILGFVHVQRQRLSMRFSSS